MFNYVYSHYFFASTTAHITAMYAAFSRGLALGAPPMLLALTLAFSSSLMMSLTHYGAGTAPIILVRVMQPLRNGGKQVS